MSKENVDMFEVLEELFKLTEPDLMKMFNSVSPEFNIKPACTFPPSNVYIDENKNMHITVALAGYKMSNIEISFEDNYMLLTTKPTKKDLHDKVKFLHRGIADRKATNRFVVPVAKYDRKSTKATFKDGLLSIEIPAKEKETIKVNIG